MGPASLKCLPGSLRSRTADRQTESGVKGELMELGKRGEIKFGHADNDNGGLGRWPINYLGLMKRATTLGPADKIGPSEVGLKAFRARTDQCMFRK